MRHALPLVLLVVGCQEYTLGQRKEPDPPEVDTDEAYQICGFNYGPRSVDKLETCGGYEVSGFNPAIDWEAGQGRTMSSTAAVADLNNDGMPEIIANITSGVIGTLTGGDNKGDLWVMHGDGSGFLWKANDANLGYAVSPAVGDIDGDGDPEVLGVRAKRSQSPIGSDPRYTLVAWDHEGNELWETDTYGKNNFDYGCAPVIVDMDGDGIVEIVAGRVIFRPDGTERGRGTRGRGSNGFMPGFQGDIVAEGSIPAVADLDLDGVMEVITGNAKYGPDGEELWYAGNPGPLYTNVRRADGVPAVANLDDDPEGEVVVSSYDTVRAHDTDGSVMWGPIEVLNATWVSAPTVADLDNDGMPEIVVAGGNQLLVLNHDGTELWSQGVIDESGASGSAVFDFDGDGIQEVVYADEQNVYAFNGDDGAIKFMSDRHASATMMEYPVIADVDADGEAEIVMGHQGLGVALTVYKEGDGRWAPARKVWNQHAYWRTNIGDDLSVPEDPTPNFSDHNTWHAATDITLYDIEGVPFDLQSEIVDICEVQCDLGQFFLAAQPINKSDQELPSGVDVTLYSVRGGQTTLVTTQQTTEAIPPGKSGEQMIFEVLADIARNTDTFKVVIDDNGRGRGTIPECIEDDNAFEVDGPFCR